MGNFMKYSRSILAISAAVLILSGCKPGYTIRQGNDGEIFTPALGTLSEYDNYVFSDTYEFENVKGENYSVKFDSSVKYNGTTVNYCISEAVEVDNNYKKEIAQAIFGSKPIYYYEDEYLPVFEIQVIVDACETAINNERGDDWSEYGGTYKEALERYNELLDTAPSDYVPVTTYDEDLYMCRYGDDVLLVLNFRKAGSDWWGPKAPVNIINLYYDVRYSSLDGDSDRMAVLTDYFGDCTASISEISTVGQTLLEKLGINPEMLQYDASESSYTTSEWYASYYYADGSDYSSLYYRDYAWVGCMGDTMVSLNINGPRNLVEKETTDKVISVESLKTIMNTEIKKHAADYAESGLIEINSMEIDNHTYLKDSMYIVAPLLNVGDLFYVNMLDGDIIGFDDLDNYNLERSNHSIWW